MSIQYFYLLKPFYQIKNVLAREGFAQLYGAHVDELQNAFAKGCGA